jgi:anti-sigma regulatory factor (Ser/Thr protein kinase)
MKKITKKQRLRDVLAHIRRLKNHVRPIKHRPSRKLSKIDFQPLNDYLELEFKKGLRHQLVRNRKKGILINLPDEMDFELNKEETLQHLNVLSLLVKYIGKNGGRRLPKGAYNLASVNFDSLKSLSTPAALVLTAELSNWEDAIRNKLSPRIKQWNAEIYSQLHDLGFFDLFENKYSKPPVCKDNCSDTRLVRYIKGFCGDSGKIRELREGIKELVGDKVDKWTFLASGLDEAITNVFHHAYPEGWERRSKEETWYMTGAFNERTQELKVIFYDQGISIPKSLPKSKWKEEIYSLLTSEERQDEQLLKAAVEYGRTRTGEQDRGKGLGDLLEFIKRRKNGRLSILSGKGQYTFSIEGNGQLTKTSRSEYPVEGTLIVWRVIL